VNFELREVSVHILEIKEPVQLVFVPSLLFDDFKLVSQIGTCNIVDDSSIDGILVSIPRDSIGEPRCRVVWFIAFDKVVAGEWEVRRKPESLGVLKQDGGSSSIWDALSVFPWL
jgi:hypothetical protein